MLFVNIYRGEISHDANPSRSGARHTVNPPETTGTRGVTSSLLAGLRPALWKWANGRWVMILRTRVLMTGDDCVQRREEGEELGDDEPAALDVCQNRGMICLRAICSP